ncbi:MAG: hypothetical protein JNM94_17125 [Phycisphaerae bacterium]|nr:hypothetical protein [Phycisphaerae bacterium]
MGRSTLITRLARLERSRERCVCPLCGPGARITMGAVDGSDDGGGDGPNVCEGCGRELPRVRFVRMTFDSPGLARALVDEVPMSPCSPDGL